MKLVVMRHGRAGDAPVDAARELTESGRADVTAVGRRLHAAGVAGWPVYCSPLVRTRQTAELVAAEIDADVTVEKALASGASLDELLGFLGARGRAPQLVVVGHMPDLGVLAGFLAWKARGRAMDLSPGTAVHLTVAKLGPHPDATLDWAMAPGDRR